MPKITAIKRQKKDGRANVYVDGAFCFGIDLETLVTTGLRVEQEYREEELEKIIEKAHTYKYFQKLVHYASLRPRSRKEIRDWMKRKKVPEGSTSILISKLEKLELVDDRKFSEWWVRQREEFRPRSARQIHAELRQKGIEEQIIKAVLDQTPIDEVASAKKLLAKQAWKYSRLNVEEKRRKQSEYLARKGFSWDIVKEVVD